MQWEEKHTWGLWGAAAGAVALAIVGFTWGGWYTSKGAAQKAEAAVIVALIPACVKDVMADPAAAAELQVKRTADFDDVVRDYRKRVDLTNLGFQFNRDCGKAIEAIMAKPATKP
jgi:alpha/beta superfamily hydrolase